MSTIINNNKLQFLKYNNTEIFNIGLTNDMLISNNKMSINIDVSKCKNKKALSFFWRFHNFYNEIDSIKLLNDFIRNANYYSMIKPFANLPYTINDDNNYDNIYSDFFSSHSYNIFGKNSFLNLELLEHNIINITISFKNEFKINENSTLEFVIQHEIEPNNLPIDLEILELNELYFVFDNFPLNLKKIKLLKNFSLDKIKNSIKKIPFGCVVEDMYGKQIIF